MRKFLSLVLLLPLLALGQTSTQYGRANFNGTTIFTPVSVPFTATPAFDASKGDLFSITLTGNVTSSTLTNVTIGQPLWFIVCQDSTGSRTFTWPTNVKNPPAIVSTANLCTVGSFFYDGTTAQSTGGGGSGTGLTGFVDASANDLQTAMNAACASGTPPTLGVYVPPTYVALDSFTNTCQAVVFDSRTPFNSVSGTLNVRNFGADGTGNGYVDMTTNVASHNVAGCYNMTAAQVIGKYLHVLRAGPGGGIFKSKVTGFSGTTCTVADLPSASIVAGGWVSSNDDDAPAFQAAVNAAAVYGAEVVIPPGNYFLLSPIKLPAHQSVTAPWTINSIHIRGLGGNYSARLYYVHNATSGPLRAIIEGPTLRTATTGWSQTGTSLTISMASNPYHVGDLLDFWSPTAGANNSGATNNPTGYGVTGGYYVSGITSTSVTVSSDLNQTVSATEAGELSQMGNPNTPFISGIDFETLDYPYGGKTGTFLANGIDTHAYSSFNFSHNFLGNLSEGIRIYRSWLGVISENECYGSNICIHAPKNLGALNAVRFKDNNLDAYGVYGLLEEANQDGGSYENSYIDNEFEGTSATTRADFACGDSGAEIRWGYSETSGSQEITYTNAIVGGSNVQFQSGFTVGIVVGGQGSHIQMNGTAFNYNGRLVTPTRTLIAGAGTFPAGRDVYVTVTGYSPTNTLETNYNDFSTYVGSPFITNTTLNDRVQVNVSSITDFSGQYTQYCVYEADVPTGTSAPTLPYYTLLNSTVTGAWKRVGCANLGTAINVDATATGSLMKPMWGIDNRNFYNSWFGVPASAARSQVNAISDNWFGFDGSLGSGPLGVLPATLGSPNDFRGGGGAVCAAGNCFGSARAQSSNPNYPNEFGPAAVIPYGMVIHNSYANYGQPSRGGVYDNSFWMFCNNPNSCTANPVVASDWVHFGELHNRQWNEGTVVPTSGAWVAGDFVRNVTPSAQSGNTATNFGWLCTASGSPGTWVPIYLNNLATPVAIGTTTPNAGTFTNLVATGSFSSPAGNSLGQTSVTGSSVNPVNVGFGPLVLLDANDGTSCTSNGASVSTWTDQSGHGTNFTPTGTSVAPTCATNVINGLNAVNFNGTTQGLGNTGFAWNSATGHGGFTFFVVAKLNATSQSSGYIWQFGATQVMFDIVNYNTMRCWEVGLAAQGMYIQDTNWHLWECDASSGSSNTGILRRDGVYSASSTSSNRTWNDTGIAVAVGSNGTTARTNIQIAYFALYDSVLSTADRQTVATYIENKFSINVATDYNPAFAVKNSSSAVKAYINSNGQLNTSGSTGGYVALAPQTTPLSGIAGGPNFICDPSAQAYANNASVTSCTDTGSGGHNAASVGTAPIFKTGIFGGAVYPSIRYAGTGYLKTSTFTLNWPATICGVVKGLNNNTPAVWDGFTKYSAAQFLAAIFTNGNNSSSNTGYDNYDGLPHVWCLVSNGAGFNSIGYQDGVQWTYNGGMGGSINLAGITLGALADGSANFSGDLGIVAAWPSALSQADITNVQTAFAPWLAVQTTTYDASTSNAFTQTLSANFTATNISNGTQGQIITLQVCQNSTGGWTYTPPSNVKGMAAIPTTASKCWAQSFQFDGTNWNSVSALMSTTGKMHSNGTAEGLTTLTYSATPIFDASLGNIFKITLTGNVTSSTLTNATAGQPLYFVICQDGTGSRTNVWPANFLGAMTIGSTASKCSAQSFVFDGTNAIAITPGVTNE